MTVTKARVVAHVTDSLNSVASLHNSHVYDIFHFMSMVSISWEVKALSRQLRLKKESLLKYRFFFRKERLFSSKTAIFTELLNLLIS